MAQSTSLAALSTVPANCIRERVLDAIRSFGAEGLTSNECADLLDIDKGTVQPRTSELSLVASIRDSGARRPNSSGKQAIVWVAR